MTSKVPSIGQIFLRTLSQPPSHAQHALARAPVAPPSAHLSLLLTLFACACAAASTRFAGRAARSIGIAGVARRHARCGSTAAVVQVSSPEKVSRHVHAKLAKPSAEQRVYGPGETSAVSDAQTCEPSVKPALVVVVRPPNPWPPSAMTVELALKWNGFVYGTGRGKDGRVLAHTFARCTHRKT
eukprot:2977574-Pleurochrysis_carterae.AAC.4